MMEAREQVPEESCAGFQERLPQLFESKAALGKEPHLETCENCAELVRDLEYIAQQAQLLLPIHDPSPNVWDNIRTAIQSDTAESIAGKLR